jgi:tetratricopeptide (TPR) repeat protein
MGWHGRWRLGVLVVVLPLVGCATGAREGGLLPSLSSDSPLTGTSAAARKESELPPAKAAEASLATAELMERHGHDVQAIYQYEMARHYNPKLDAKVRRKLAYLYDRIGDWPRAMAEYERCLAETPRDADLLNDIGYCQYQQGNWAEAERWFRAALEQQPGHARAAINLGMALGQQGRYAEAEAAFERVNTAAEAQVNLAFIYQTQGKREEAKAAYRKALALQPELELARRALAKLETPPKPASEEQVAVAGEEDVRKERPALCPTPAPSPQRGRVAAEATGARIRNGPPDRSEALKQQKNREAELARLEEFVRRYKAETNKVPPAAEPPTVIDPSAARQPTAPADDSSHPSGQQP